MLGWAPAVAVAWPAALAVAAAPVLVEVESVAELPQPASSTTRITPEALRNALSDRRADRFDLGVSVGQPFDALLDLRRGDARIRETKARLTAL